jgi:hypothetical protein
MEEGYGMGVMQGVVVYMALLAFMVLGGAAYWVGYRVFGVGLAIVSAALLLWFAAGAPI